MVVNELLVFLKKITIFIDCLSQYLLQTQNLHILELKNINIMKKILSILLILLLVPSISYANKWHIKMKKKEKKDFAHYVLKAQLDNKMVFPLRNIKNPDFYRFFDEFEDHLGVKEKGIEFNLKYSFEGHKQDWTRWGVPGHAQRFQIMEPYKETTKKNKTKWYRIGYFVPADIRTDNHTISLFDFKKLYGKGEKTSDAQFNIIDNRFSWVFNSSNYLATKNETESEYFYFDHYIVTLDQNFVRLKGKWVNILINAKWSEQGFLHLWIDGKLISSYFGDTLGGASSVRFKFGPYRHHMDNATKEGIEIPDTIIRYSNVGKSDNCDDLWSGCSELMSQLSNQSQVNGASNVHLCKSTSSQSGYCENLGYPKNQRPF